MTKINDRSRVQTQLFTYLMKQPRWRRQLKLIIKSTIKYPAIRYRQRHTRLIDNSDDYGQLKSTRNKVNNSQWKSKSDNDEVRRKSQSTINEGSRHSTKGIDDQRSTRNSKVRQSQIDLLSAATISTIKMADNIRSDNSKRLTTIGNQKLYTPKSKDRDFINSQKRKWNGSRTYLESQATVSSESTDAVKR